jgi:hypothetical protein
MFGLRGNQREKKKVEVKRWKDRKFPSFGWVEREGV